MVGNLGQPDLREGEGGLQIDFNWFNQLCLHNAIPMKSLDTGFLVRKHSDVQMVACPDSTKSGYESSVFYPYFPRPCPVYIFILLFLICILYNKAVIASVMLSVNSVSCSNKTWRCSGNSWIYSQSEMCVTPETCDWHLKWGESCGGPWP